MFQAEWNLLEEGAWSVPDPRQRTLVPPLAGQQAAVKVDSSDVWKKRVRLQIALQVESRMEAWRESIGQSTEGTCRPSPSQANLEFMAAHESGQPPYSNDWGQSMWWTTPTEEDVLSEVASGYDEDSRSCAAA